MNKYKTQLRIKTNQVTNDKLGTHKVSCEQ